MPFRYRSRRTMSQKIFLVVSAYWIISISLVFMNKWLLSNKSNEVLPLSIIFVSMVSFNNLCLKHLSVSFYFLARCLTTIYNVIFTYLILHTKTSGNALICCAAIIVGYAAGVLIEGNLGTLSILGIIFGIGSSVTCALNSIYTAKSLPKVEGSVWILTFYNNLNSMIISIPVIGLLEGRNLAYQLLNTSFIFWLIMIISGLMGFAIGYVSTLQIQITSPLTHNVSGTAKAAAQTVLAVMIYHEIKSIPWWLSNLVVLVASAAYAYVRQVESKQKSLVLHQRESDVDNKFEEDKDPLLLSKT